MQGTDTPGGRPRWHWERSGGARLIAADGTEFACVDGLSRIEVERLLGLRELDAVLIRCGSGVRRWVGPEDARGLWHEVESDLGDVEGRRPRSVARGARPYRAELWRSEDGRHVLVFVNE